MSAPKLKVLISGAGVAGPCLAYWLARTRLHTAVTIVERSPVPRVTGQAIDIRGSAIDIVKEMGLEEGIRARHTTETGTQFINSSGKPFVQFDSGDGNTFTAEYEILRADLAELFLEATERFDNIKYIYGDHVESLEQTEKDVTVTFAGGSKDTFDLVVAADGGTSKIRSMILDQTILKDCYNFLGQYIAFFSIPHQPHDNKMWKWYSAPKGLALMTRPHRNPSTMGAYACITTSARGKPDPVVEEALEKGTEESKRMLHAYFDNAGWEAKRILSGMDSCPDFYMSRIAQVRLPKWTNHRALVLGDAAHATFGVGTSLAIEGAYILAGELAKIETASDVPRAVERFEEVFRPIYAEVEMIPRGFPQLACPQSAWGLWIRDTLMWIVGKTGVYKFFQGNESVVAKLPSYDWAADEKGGV